MARQKKPDRFICIEDRKRGELRYRVHAVRGGRRVVEGFRTEEEAKDAAATVKRATAHLNSPAVESALETYFAEMLQRGKWRKDAIAYSTKTGQLRTFLQPIDDMPVAMVTAVHVDRCCRTWDTPGRSAEWTRRNARVRARAFFAWAVRAKLIRSSPMDDSHMVPRPRRQLGRLSLDEARRLRAVIDPAAARGDQSAVFVLAALLMGARTSELVGLRRRDLDDGGRVVSYQDAKAPSVVHRVRLPVVLVAPMRRLAAEADGATGLLLDEARDRQWGARAVRRWASEAGLGMAEEMDARWLRRTKDTLAVEAGVSSEVVARETGHTLHVARLHYIGHGAETTQRAAAMDEATRDAGNDSRDTSTGVAKLAK